MAWVNPTTRSSGYLVTAANWNELVNNMKHLMLVNHTQFVADVPVTATTVGTANQIVSAGAITYEAVPHLIEAWFPRFSGGANPCNIILRDSTTVLGTLAIFVTSSTHHGVTLQHRLTPTAATHTYNIAGWNSGAATATIDAGSGGTAGDGTTFMPGFIRITREIV